LSEHELQKYSPSTRKIFACDRDDFKERQSAALQRRLGAIFTGKMLAYEIGVHPDTVMNWVSGRSTMDGSAIESVSAFFAARGDYGFLPELFNGARPNRVPARDLLQADRCLWFTGEGAAQEAPLGHARFVRDALKIESDVDDFAGYAIRNLGWVECLARSDGRVGLRFAEATADPAAVIRARDWLQSAGQTAQAPEITVWRNGDWHYSSSVPISDAARMLDRVGVSVAFNQMAERDWVMERLPISAIESPGMKSLLAAYNEGAGLAKAALQLGLMNMSSLLTVEGSNVTSIWIGPGLGLPNELFLNRNVLDRPDRNYASLVHYHILEAASDGPTFYRLDIEIMGRRRRYERLAVRDQQNLVMTSTRLLQQGMAA
jgi:hypothetical protein